jgi:hypothetical protein
LSCKSLPAKTFCNSLLQAWPAGVELPSFSKAYGEFVARAMSQNPHEQAEAYSTFSSPEDFWIPLDSAKGVHRILGIVGPKP